MKRFSVYCYVFIISVVGSFVSAQDVSVVSLRIMLEDLGILVSWEESAEPEGVDGFDISKQYEVTVTSSDGTEVPLNIWLARQEDQNYFPFISMGYYGLLDTPLAETLGSFLVISSICLGIDDATTQEVRDFFVEKLSSDLTTEWTTETKELGTYSFATSGKLEEEDNANFLVDFYNANGVPGENNWTIVCED